MTQTQSSWAADTAEDASAETAASADTAQRPQNETSSEGPPPQAPTQSRETISVSADVSGAEGKAIGFETGRLAGLANGAVVGSIGDTKVLVTATASRSARKGADFFPLTVDMEERMYAAGKIPGSFFRREGRSSDAATLTCRLTDRPLRPCFPKGFRNDVHVVGLVMSADQHNPYDVTAINAASAALCMSGIPFSGPVGAVRIAFSTEGHWIPHPTFAEMEEASFEMVVAGRMISEGSGDGSGGAAGAGSGGPGSGGQADVAIMMVEASGTENAGRMYEQGAVKVDEEVLADGLERSKQWIREVISLQRQLIASAGVKPVMDYVTFSDTSQEVLEAVRGVAGSRPMEVEQLRDKDERAKANEEMIAEVLASLEGHDIYGTANGSANGAASDAAGESSEAPDAQALESQIKAALRTIGKESIRERIVAEGVRADGRGTADIRPLNAEAAVLPLAHGSGIFERGETQVMNVATLGSERMDQIIDTIDPVDRKRYLHHYNFPPFSTGETGFMRGPKRREIGHGALAERALLPVVPSFEDFPYTLRLVSEVLSSNGSTSMASVCASSLSLMDAGVPIIMPVAGIAMGLIHEGDQYVTLTDILGAEDAYGDMDFKVAGTKEYVTALQLDTKIDGIPAQVLASALQQAKDARLKVLQVMDAALAAPRDDVRENAPKILTFEIPSDKVGDVIGPKGKVINQLQADTGTEINVDDSDGVARVTISSPNRVKVDEAKEMVDLIINPPEPEMGKVYTGTVVNITSFGAFVNFLPGRDGLVHISKLGGKRRLERVEEVLAMGDVLEVVVDEMKNDRVSLRLAGPQDGRAEDDGGHDGGDVESHDDSWDHGDEDRGGGDRTAGDRTAGDDSGETKHDGGYESGRDGGRDGRHDGMSDRGRGEDHSSDRREVSFGQEFDRQIESDYGDLGPATQRRSRR